MTWAFPPFFKMLTALALATALLPVQASAQGRPTTVPPQIELPLAPDPPAGQPVVPAPAVPQPGGGGEIRLPVPAPADPDPTETPGDQQLAEPPSRDRTDSASAVVPDLVLAMAPATPLPFGARIGASLAEPGIMRLTGEIASVSMVLQLPEMLVMPTQLRLTLRSSVNILPENSELGISINDGPPQTVPLTQIGPFATVFIPAPGLTVGLNNIELLIRQPHRIFCGPDATFAVWTEIDLANSGVAVPPSTLQTEIDGFLAGLQTQVASGRPLAILADEDTDPATIRAVATRLAELVGGPVPVTVRSFYEMALPGPVSVALIPSDRVHFAFRRSARDSIVLQLEYAGTDLPDLSAMSGAAIPTPRPRIPQAARLVPGTSTTFAALGVDDFAGNTHYFTRGVQFRLPDDWLLLSNQRARMALRYGFAADLPPGALVLIKVNGQTVRLLPLDKRGGRLMPLLDIRFPANLLHAGQNDVAFEMIVPGNPSDEACPPRRADMLVVLSDSNLTVPPAPRMRMGGLAESLRALDGGAIVVPADARAHAALSREVVAMTALLPAVASDDIGGDRGRLSVVRLEDVGLMPVHAFPGLTARRIAGALTPPSRATLTAPAPAPVEAPRFRLTEDGPATLRIEEAPGFGTRIWNGITSSFTSEGWIARDLARLRAALFLVSDGALSDWLSSRNGRAVLIQPDPADPFSLWLILASDTPVAEAARAIDTLRRDGVAQGEAALLQSDGSWQIWSSGRPPRLLEPVRPGNVLAVLGNYASWSPLLFTLSLLVLALLSCVPALLYILMSRPQEGGR